MIGADAPAKVLDHKAVFLAAGGDRELIILNDDADGDAVKGRDGSRESVRFDGRCCSEKLTEQEAKMQPMLLRRSHHAASVQRIESGWDAISPSNSTPPTPWLASKPPPLVGLPRPGLVFASSPHHSVALVMTLTAIRASKPLPLAHITSSTADRPTEDGGFFETETEDEPYTSHRVARS
jgi:hypothetical protein